MTAAQNILAVLETVGLRRREQLKRLEELLEEFGIAHVRNTRGDALSGGERRRTEIARALATEPHYILLDERIHFDTGKYSMNVGRSHIGTMPISKTALR